MTSPRPPPRPAAPPAGRRRPVCWPCQPPSRRAGAACDPLQPRRRRDLPGFVHAGDGRARSHPDRRPIRQVPGRQGRGHDPRQRRAEHDLHQPRRPRLLFRPGHRAGRLRRQGGRVRADRAPHQETVDGKLAYWGPKLGADAPARTVVPEVLAGNSWKAASWRSTAWTAHSPTAASSGSLRCGPWRAAWSCSATCMCGWPTQTPKSHQDWLATLARIEALKPKTVIPGHYAQGAPLTVESVRYGRLHPRLRRGRRPGQDSAALIAAMKAKYPQAGEPASLG